MIFVDANVPMYLVGTPHRNQERAVAVLRRLAQERETFVTDVEVYQEILHRYTETRRISVIDSAIDTLNNIVSEVMSYGMPEIYAARDLIAITDGVSARDALHAAIMRQAGISRILSYDRGFDAIPGIERLE